MHLRNKYTHFFLFIIITIIPPTNSHAANKKYEKIVGDRILTLWSDKESCHQEGANIISIESKGDTYKVAACSKYGCRAAISEFGKQAHPMNYRFDPIFVWISDTVFETKINGKNKRFFQCKF